MNRPRKREKEEKDGKKRCSQREDRKVGRFNYLKKLIIQKAMKRMVTSEKMKHGRKRKR